MDTTQNPLLKESPYQHHALDFASLKTEHFLPALTKTLEDARRTLKSIKEDKNETFESVILALEQSTEGLDTVAAVFYNLLSAHSNEELQKIAMEFGPLISELKNDIVLDEQIFQKVSHVKKQTREEALNLEEQKLLDNTYSDFVRNGALLTEVQKQRLREIDQQLSRLGPEYSENVLKATNHFEEFISDERDLAGLPEGARDAARLAAEVKGKNGWIFTLQAPSMIAVLKYAENRSLREKVWRGYNSRSFQDAFDNQKAVLEIVKLRHERAHLLGYATHADFVLEKRMAESPRKVFDFLEELLIASTPAAKRDLQEVQDFAQQNNGPQPLMPWDFNFYSEKLKESKYSYNEEDLRPYFKLENVVEGVFEHARRLYGLVFKLSSSYPVYHPEVNVYEVVKEHSGEFIGLFYTDFFPRDSKRGGAWMTNYFEQGLFQGEILRPHVGIVCNFTPPTSARPALLTFDEVRTLFHEFGHSLHSLLSHCHFRSLSGTNVYWDFVELPSQIFENWTLEKEALDVFAKHYQTGAALPTELTQKIIAASRFLAGYQSLRQLSFALLDMAWHSTDPDQIRNVDQFEKTATERTRLLPAVPGMNISCAFSHIFAGGYSAGYYSYKWAEVLDADAFEYFKEHGIFNRKIADLFRENVLSRGGTEHPMVLYKKFRGQEPDPKALLRRDGLL